MSSLGIAVDWPNMTIWFRWGRLLALRRTRG